MKMEHTIKQLPINRTDEETYQYLKGIDNPNIMGADEWKRRRKIELNKEGKVWSK